MRNDCRFRSGFTPCLDHDAVVAPVVWVVRAILQKTIDDVDEKMITSPLIGGVGRQVFRGQRGSGVVKEKLLVLECGEILLLVSRGHHRASTRKSKV